MADDDERRRRKRAREAEADSRPESRSESASSPPGERDEASSIEGAGEKDGEKGAKRRWSLDDVITALRTRPRVLDDGTVHVNDKILRALAKVGAKAVAPVLDVLRADDWTARWAALAALSRMIAESDAVEAKQVLPNIVAALDDKRSRVRAKALEALAGVRGAKDEKRVAFIKALGDSDAEVSRMAVMHLLELKLDPAKLTDELVEVVTKKRSVYLRVGALTVLMHLGKAAKPAVPYLIELLEDPAPEVREYANLALTAIRTPSMRLQVIRTASMRLKAVEAKPKDEAPAEEDEGDEEDSDEDESEESEESESEDAKKAPVKRIKRRRPRRRF